MYSENRLPQRVNYTIGHQTKYFPVILFERQQFLVYKNEIFHRRNQKARPIECIKFFIKYNRNSKKFKRAVCVDDKALTIKGKGSFSSKSLGATPGR
jgi:hypothetical protein